MAENTAETATQQAQEGQERTFTQDELNKVVADRLARERAKYADYDELKGKAAKFDEAEEASKTELQRALDTSNRYKESADKLKAELDELKAANERRELISKKAAEYQVDEGLLRRMSGDVEDNAKFLQQMAEARKGKHPILRDAGEPGEQAEPRKVPIII